MAWGVRWYPVGSIVLGVLGVLAGCSGSMFFAEREPWRHDAEVQCLNAGAVREGPGVVRITAIRGPGVCGADFPLRVSVLGASGPLGYSDEFSPEPYDRRPLVDAPAPPRGVTRTPLQEPPDGPRYGAPPPVVPLGPG